MTEYLEMEKRNNGKVRVYHAVNVDDKQVVIDIHEIANESIRKMKLEYQIMIL